MVLVSLLTVLPKIANLTKKIKRGVIFCWMIIEKVPNCHNKHHHTKFAVSLNLVCYLGEVKGAGERNREATSNSIHSSVT